MDGGDKSRATFAHVDGTERSLPLAISFRGLTDQAVGFAVLPNHSHSSAQTTAVQVPAAFQ